MPATRATPAFHHDLTRIPSTGGSGSSHDKARARRPRTRALRRIACSGSRVAPGGKGTVTWGCAPFYAHVCDNQEDLLRRLNHRVPPGHRLADAGQLQGCAARVCGTSGRQRLRGHGKAGDHSSPVCPPLQIQAADYLIRDAALTSLARGDGAMTVTRRRVRLYVPGPPRRPRDPLARLRDGRLLRSVFGSAPVRLAPRLCHRPLADASISLSMLSATGTIRPSRRALPAGCSSSDGESAEACSICIERCRS